jgi:signal transduction histidine kinase
VKEKGIGLGMTVSYKIIKDHGGRVGVRSQLGEGTVVDVILPKYNPSSK